MTAMLQKADEAAHDDDAQKILPDRVHPSFSGHLVMAEQLVKAWGGRPLVAKVTIHLDGGRPTIESAEFAHVSDLTAESKGLRWTEKDDALPLPFPQWETAGGIGPMPLVLKSSDVTEAMNQEPLRVKGLKPGVYAIKIDGSAVGTFNDDELSRGVNLAILNTPMTEQAKRVYDLSVSHCNVHNASWRTVQVPLSKENLPEVASAMAASDSLEQAILKKRKEAAQPNHTSLRSLSYSKLKIDECQK